VIEFNNKQDKIEFNEDMEKLIENAINAAIEFEGFNYDYEVSVVITDNDDIREINREYRNIDNVTDVLSFPMLEFEKDKNKNSIFRISENDKDPETGNVVLGDIVLSLEKACDQAEEYGHSKERETAFLTVHSILHLLGYDHEMEEDRVIMREKEESVLNRMNLSR
jgi:probable rRNA maturation factor